MTLVDFVLARQVEILVEVRTAFDDDVRCQHLEIANLVHCLKQAIAVTLPPLNFADSFRIGLSCSVLNDVIHCVELVDHDLSQMVVIDTNHGPCLLLAHILHEPALERYLDYSLMVFQTIKHLPAFEVTNRVTDVEDGEGACLRIDLLFVAE